MKTATLITLATLLLLPNSILAQENASPARHDAATAAKVLVVSGRVSNDGKMLDTDLDSEWQINNPEALKGHEGRLVRIRCYVDTARNKIQVLTVKKDDDTNYTATRHTDSAFRR
ncbi:MAG TPA: hypothetical protein VGS05_11285 [Candidatus Sulfotelmatobacter sp.]|nr:hypothetical protein [Candidatus Sulfotelmatobacter sp.]